MFDDGTDPRAVCLRGRGVIMGSGVSVIGVTCGDGAVDTLGSICVVLGWAIDEAMSGESAVTADWGGGLAELCCVIKFEADEALVEGDEVSCSDSVRLKT